MRHFFLLLLATALLAACSSTAADDMERIDYAALDELEISSVLEITESDDYLPGALYNLHVNSRGDILVRDGSKVAIEQFDSRGNHLATIAAEGGGPGEISQSSSILGMAGDTLIVKEFMSQKTSTYVPGPDGIYRHLDTVSPENASMAIPMGTATLFSVDQMSSRTTSFADLMGREDEIPANSYSYVKIVDRRNNVVRDSLHYLNFPNPYILQSGNNITVHSGFPYQYEDRMRRFNDGSYLIARADSSIFEFYDRSHNRTNKINFRSPVRPLDQGDVNHLISESGALREVQLERLPDFKPPFLNVWVSDSHIWLHTDNTEEGVKELVVLTLEGEPVGRTNLGETESFQTVVDNNLYVIDNQSELGPVIRKYRVGL